MAPQNLNQVFIANNVDMLATSTFSNNAATSASIVNVWDVDAGTNFDGAALTTKKRIQITQTMPSGNCIASPIIDVKNIKRINFEPWTVVAPKVAVQTVTWAAAPNAAKAVMVRIAIRTYPTIYNDFANPTNAYSDLSGGGYTFPLLGNFSAGRMIFNIEVPAGTYTTTTIGDAIRTAIADNDVLNAVFVTSGTSTLVLTARHYGVQFDLTVQYSDKTTNDFVTSVVSTQATASSASNYLMALSEEKKQRARYGNFNRMYFPFAFPEFAQPGFKYDTIEIQYVHDHPASTGIARAAEINTVRIYAGASSTALTYLAAATGTNLQSVFGYTFGTTSTYEQVF